MRVKNLDKSRTKFQGIFFVVMGIMALTSMDFTVKVLRDDLSAPMIAVFRNLFALPILIIMTWASGRWQAFHIDQIGLLTLRGFCITGAQFSFFFSLAFLPLATAITIFSVAPLLITFLSWLLLNERLSKSRIFAVVIGFAAVLLVMRPGMGVLHWSSIFPLISALFYAIIVVSMNWFKTSGNSAAITFWGNAIAFVTGLAFMLFLHAVSIPTLTSPVSAHLPWLVAMGVFGAIGALFMNMAYRLSEASLIAPFDYLGIALAIVVDFLAFAIWPDIATWIGINLIIAANLILIYRERKSNQ